MKELFIYDGQKLIRRVTTGKTAKAGTSPTHVSVGGYLQVQINYSYYYVHRLIWLYEYGQAPNGNIDHIDHDKQNNSIGNLRDVSQSQNTKNKKLYKRNISGVHGVRWSNRDSRWLANIGVDGKTIYLGSFQDKEEAVKARKNAELQYNFHENHGQGEE